MDKTIYSDAEFRQQLKTLYRERFRVSSDITIAKYYRTCKNVLESDLGKNIVLYEILIDVYRAVNDECICRAFDMDKLIWKGEKACKENF